MSESLPSESARATYEAALSHLPTRLQPAVERLLSRWPGRIAIRSAATSIRIELFDRSMTIAAQFFTSVFPTLIMIATWIGGGSSELADAMGIPAQTQSVLDDALESDSGTATFGILGTLIVLASATSLSRALTRAFTAIWGLPRPKTQLTNAWRWVAVILALALALITARALTRYLSDLPPPTFWQLAASLTFDVGIGIFVPWILLAGEVRMRHLMPGAAIFGVVMLLVRPASSVWLPHALEASADRYGSIGVAFTYLAWLYVVAFCFLTASVLGQVIATDAGWFGQWIRGSKSVEEGSRRTA
ncbi:MAG: YhjD/YihY/BrkB family envelope integrity protein [Nocardioides sp.]